MGEGLILLKRKIVSVVIIAILICVNGCDRGSLSIQEDVLKCMTMNGIEKCYITKANRYENINYIVENVDVSQVEVDEYISDELESYEKLIDVKGRTIVEDGDFVGVSYVVYYKGKEVNNVENENLKVGAGYFNKEIESALIGAKIGKTIKTTISVPENDENRQLAGKTEIVEITVRNIWCMETEKLTDKFVKEYYGLRDVDAFYKFVKRKILEQKKAEAETIAKETLMNQVIQCYKYDLDEDVVLNYALSKYNDYEAMAKGYGTTMEEFVLDFFGESLEDFYESCYEDAENEIKGMLVIGAIAFEHNLNFSKETIIEEEGEDKSSSRDMDAKDTVFQKYQKIKEKVMEYIISEISEVSS